MNVALVCSILIQFLRFVPEFAFSVTFGCLDMKVVIDGCINLMDGLVGDVVFLLLLLGVMLRVKNLVSLCCLSFLI